MIDLAYLKRLIETVESSDIDTLEISRWATRIRISKSPAVVAGGNAVGGIPMAVPAGANPSPALASPAEPAATVSPAETAPADGRVEVSSPMVGTFYRAPNPDAEPYVGVGDHVKVGQTLCILEAMKLMNELEAEIAGTIKEVCVENAEPVEYGQALFRIIPD